MTRHFAFRGESNILHASYIHISLSEQIISTLSQFQLVSFAFLDGIDTLHTFRKVWKFTYAVVWIKDKWICFSLE